MTDPSPPPRRSRGKFVARLLFGLVILGLVAVGLRLTLSPKGDPLAAAAANARGIANMEQFDDGFTRAIPEFEQAIAAAPDWIPAQINLGIALFNTQQPDKIDRAISIFKAILEKDPNQIHAHYCLGLIAIHRGELATAHERFTTVTRLDPNDAHGWYLRGFTHPNRDEDPETKEFYKTALKLNPYLNAARYALAQHRHDYSAEESLKLLAEQKALVEANWEREYSIKYSESGRYAEVIGKLPPARIAIGPLPMFAGGTEPNFVLAPGTRWATPDEIAKQPEGELLKRVREQHGATIVQLDVNSDGKLDLLFAAAVIRDGKLGDALFQQDADGVFRDVSVNAGLGSSCSIGVAAADYDNSGTTDLATTNLAGGLKLWKNVGGRFEDVSTASGVGSVQAFSLACQWVDLDQDGDVDLIYGVVADLPTNALKTLAGGPNTPGELGVMLNVGEAPPAPANQPPPPLASVFTSLAHPSFQTTAPVVGLIATDLDGDADVDIVLCLHRQPPVSLFNDRLLNFHQASKPFANLAQPHAGCVFDVNQDSHSELLFVDRVKESSLFVSKESAAPTDELSHYDRRSLPLPALVQATPVDLDGDGRTELIGVTTEKSVVVFRSDEQENWNRIDAAFGPTVANLKSVIGVSVGAFGTPGTPDVVIWDSSNTQPRLLKNQANSSRFFAVELVGRRDKGSNMRTNNNGIGAKVIAQSGLVRTMIERTTRSAGLGQSMVPLAFGLGNAPQADTIRIRWPDQVVQAELNFPAANVARIVEENRKGTSCPVLFTWDGERFEYVTDFLGAGAMGEVGADGSVRPARPEESVKIEPNMLRPISGEYRIVIAEPMDEVLYLDHLRLDVIDLPAADDVFPDERFVTSGLQPSQKLLHIQDRMRPIRAKNHRGESVLNRLSARDGQRVNDYLVRSWLGFAEQHFVQLDFGEALSKLPSETALTMVFAGWTDYPYPESIYAAGQAGVPMVPPILEAQLPDGRWEKLCELGFPAGLPRVMTSDVTMLAGAPARPLRIRTNLQISWDELFVCPTREVASSKVQSLAVKRAELVHRGMIQEILPNGEQPIAYAYDQLESVAVTPWQGRLTRLGDVTPLLTQSDDCFVVCGPGEEIRIAFDASALTPIPEGSRRSFVLRTAGYCKDTSPFTLTGRSVGPLPNRAMKNYPADVLDERTMPPNQKAYDLEWNTRPAGGR